MITLKETGASFVLDGATQLEWAVSANRNQTDIRITAPTKIEAEAKLLDCLLKLRAAEDEARELRDENAGLRDTIAALQEAEEDRRSREKLQLELAKESATATSKKPRLWWSRV